MPTVTMRINGSQVSADVPENTLLVDYLRDHLRLTGTHVGCDTSQCGACVVHINGKSAKSCTRLAAQCENSEVLTIEGLAPPDGTLHPLQVAFKEAHGLQCGFCTPGMIMSALDLLQTNPKPTDPEIRSWLKGNICRCTGYQNIITAIESAAGQMDGHINEK